ncbi:hypothetical protein Trco_003061 [Trichoderma cornu-damae]|uniref:CCHC-type domain-containing protein n=1 Tax=Trichoderma cornu-damae TaxID=654480 RepID=A0A9P8QQL1_9HYPO|nr:hypothetical protein Trco_003061 [Trichoderma cornu-damae]
MDSVVCRNCEETGHYSKECPKPTDWSKVQCSNCEQFGHTKVRCKLPPKDAEAFGAQAFAEADEPAAQPDDGYGGSAGSGAGGW